jgi:hypothetical protein
MFVQIRYKTDDKSNTEVNCTLSPNVMLCNALNVIEPIMDMNSYFEDEIIACFCIMAKLLRSEFVFIGHFFKILTQIN